MRRKIPGGVLRQVEPDHWIVTCHSCSAWHGNKRGSKHGDDEQTVMAWWDKHLAPDSEHWKIRYPDEAMRRRMAEHQALQEFYRSIFAKPKP